VELHCAGALIAGVVAVAAALRGANNTTVQGLVFLTLIWGVPAAVIGSARLIGAILERVGDD
jgi:hypothetical protein